MIYSVELQEKQRQLLLQKQKGAATGELSFNQLNVKVIDAKNVNPQNLNAYDYQGISWAQVAGIHRNLYIEDRKQNYQPYRQYQNQLIKHKQPNRVADGKYFQIQKYYQGLKPKNTHFQLKDCVQAVSHHDVYFMGNERLNHLSTLRENIRYFDLLNDSNIQDWESLRQFRYACFSVDDECFALGGFKGGLYFHNITTKKGQYLKNITKNYTDPEGDTINFLKIYKEGNNKKLISAQNDRYVNIYDLECLYQPKQSVKCTNSVNVAKLNPIESDLLAIFADQQNPELIDLRSNEVIASLQGHSDFGLTLDWNPNGVTLCTGNQDGTALIWDIRNLSQQVHTLQGNMGNISQVKFDPTGSYLVSMECSDYLNIYDIYSNYQNFQVINYIGASTGFDIYQDKIFVGIHINDYNGIMEIQKTKPISEHQSRFEQFSI
ncbi:WD domain, G-beta repeat protein (macronuclear) [Tetrahymena thermophila SB210]|uniref:WD domain, G-beta repeat protein n=1 Tax=Tetrahymena thermophila (strain SB210) TaxID=312017 RepID=Q22WH2_TETTS|nr:WD domain, G-beta repeat protein [Tetrahymena thermophila SB210]EAR89445.1 WD domain, G-beta repeat protein [Tetrahymena thermophila SB210]|eukprot:XP_001009690.1 WD domain, G-beta repeat protein [Tetrahymena thermophila SB210]